MRKIFSIFLLFFYLFGVVKLSFVYATHDFFHKISHEEHTDMDCNGSCTIIIGAEKSDKDAETKSYKISVDNFSSHIVNYFEFTPQLSSTNFIHNNITSSPPLFSASDTPPPRI